jgi:hypothetical protein
VPPKKQVEEPKVSLEERWGRWEKTVRAFAILAIGLAALINEFFLREEPRTSVLIFVGSMLGIPFVMGADERLRKK